MKVSRKKRVRNYQTRDILKEAIKEVQEVAKGGNASEAKKVLDKAYKVIDTAAKKNIIHKNNAARKKSSMAKLVAGMSAAKKAAPKKDAPVKKEVKAEKEEKAEK